MKSYCVSCPTFATIARQAPLSTRFSRQEYWSGLHSHFQGIFPTQGSNLGFLHCRQILYHLSHQGSPTHIINKNETNKSKIHFACMCVKSLQLYPTLCDPWDWSPPGSSVHGILQARILEWVAVPSSRGPSRPRV